MLQRKSSAPGKTLGLTTGWTIRAELTRRGVAILIGVTYLRIDADGLHIVHDGASKLIEADTIVVCAGQEAEQTLYRALQAQGAPVHIIGSAKLATELDANRAIPEGMELARSS